MAAGAKARAVVAAVAVERTVAAPVPATLVATEAAPVVTALEGTATTVVTTVTVERTALVATLEGTATTVVTTLGTTVAVERATLVTPLEATATALTPVAPLVAALEAPLATVTVEGPALPALVRRRGRRALLALGLALRRLLGHRELLGRRRLRLGHRGLGVLAALAGDPGHQPVGLLAQLGRTTLGALQLLGELGDLTLGLLGRVARGLRLDLGHGAGAGDLGDLRVEGGATLDDVARGVDAGVLHQTEDLAPLVRQGQRDDRAGTARTGGTAGAVQVVLVVAGRVHVQDQVDAVDVDAARGDVRRDQDVDVPVLEVGQGAGAGALGHAAVQRVGLHAGLAQLLGDAVGAQLGADEDDRAALAGGDRGGDRRLVLGLHDEDVVRHRRDGALGRVHLVGDGAVQVAVDEGLDLVLHRGGEEHALAARRDLVEQLGDLGQEAQVGHLVGLVQDGDLHVLQGAGAAVDDVAQAARGGDEDVDTALQGVDLVAHGGAAADDLHLQADDVAVRLEGVRDLHGQLTGRGEDDGAGPLLLGAAAGQLGQGRQTEGEGLAGAGAATAEDVLADQGVRDGRRLDREGGRHAVLCELAHNALGEAEVGEGGLGGGVGGLGGLGDLGRHVDEFVFELVLGHDELISTGHGHAYAKPSGVSSARARQLRDSLTTASMRSATAKESTRHTARSVVAPGKWDQTIYHHTHPTPLKANRAS